MSKVLMVINEPPLKQRKKGCIGSFQMMIIMFPIAHLRFKQISLLKIHFLIKVNLGVISYYVYINLTSCAVVNTCNSPPISLIATFFSKTEKYRLSFSHKNEVLATNSIKGTPWLIQKRNKGLISGGGKNVFYRDQFSNICILQGWQT